METKDLEIAISLMQDLKKKMELGEDDLGERLGRKKPDLEIVKVGLDEEEAPESDLMDMDESGMEEEEMPESPEEKLKKRLMKLRG